MAKTIKILYEDTNILAIDKPSGILVHPAPEQARDGASPDQETILDIFRKKYPKLEIAHRLDRDTSGVMLLAKNKKAHEFLKRQFQARTIKKTYHTIVSGWLKEERGVINKPIGRSPSDFRKYSASRGARGEMREASTRYKLLKRLGVKNKFTYLEVFPKTGRTHQIRVHMKAIDHPVACDPLYNPNKPCPKGFSRMALHAKSIEFRDLRDRIVKVESPLPLIFRKMVK